MSDDHLVYGGYSAGSCVAAPDLEGIHLMDDPAFIPEGYREDVTPQTLHLVPWRIVPHWRSDHPKSVDAEKAVEHLRPSGLDFRTLRDGEALIVANGESRVSHNFGCLLPPGLWYTPQTDEPAAGVLTITDGCHPSIR
jgi:dipeptidase E